MGLKRGDKPRKKSGGTGELRGEVTHIDKLNRTDAYLDRALNMDALLDICDIGEPGLKRYSKLLFDKLPSELCFLEKAKLIVYIRSGSIRDNSEPVFTMSDIANALLNVIGIKTMLLSMQINTLLAQGKFDEINRIIPDGLYQTLIKLGFSKEFIEVVNFTGNIKVDLSTLGPNDAFLKRKEEIDKVINPKAQDNIVDTKPS